MHLGQSPGPRVPGGDRQRRGHSAGPAGRHLQTIRVQQGRRLRPGPVHQPPDRAGATGTDMWPNYFSIELTARVAADLRHGGTFVDPGR